MEEEGTFYGFRQGDRNPKVNGTVSLEAGMDLQQKVGVKDEKNVYERIQTVCY